MPRIVDEYRELVDDLAESLALVNIDRARAELRKLVGKILSEQAFSVLIETVLPGFPEDQRSAPS